MFQLSGFYCILVHLKTSIRVFMPVDCTQRFACFDFEGLGLCEFFCSGFGFNSSFGTLSPLTLNPKPHSLNPEP